VNDGVWRLGLLGHPVQHSLSPALHTAALASTGQVGTYTLIDCPAEGLDAAVARLREGAFDGLNVTLPHKEALVPLVDRLEGAAAAIGAVNTLLCTPEGVVEGHNTDVPGLVTALEARWPETPWRWLPVTVIGAGGAARAAVLAADQLGAGEIRITNRTQERAERVVSELQARCRAPLLSLPIERAFQDAALVLQATSVGMSWRPEQSQWGGHARKVTEQLRRARPGAACFDLVYRPRVTAWMQGAVAAGHEVEDGLGMLVAQAAASFGLWTGSHPDKGAMQASVLGALSERLK
jgi:shikimate dehydrogenase